MSDAPAWPMPSVNSPEAILARAAQHLADKYEGVFSHETIQRFLEESYQLLAVGATVSTHLPNLAIRFATDRLAAVARNKGVHHDGGPEVLFVCVHNAGRSQMAAALLDHHAAPGGSKSAPPARFRPRRLSTADVGDW